MWIGVEKENRLHGLRTLFVRGDQNMKDIANFATTNKAHHIYFGAGLSQVTDWTVVRLAVTSFYVVTVETTDFAVGLIPADLLFSVHIVLRVVAASRVTLKPTDEIKIHDTMQNVVYVSEVGLMRQVDINYWADVEVAQ
jgi:hypothetical protein